ncbi:MAG: S-layer homology domain-containing protein [Acutalibacter sp.]|nr:S-layer homology domain-containing protein [Acutalibacter sp.]
MQLFKRKNQGRNEERPRPLRRGLALLLCAAMMLSMLPVSALAAEGDPIVPQTPEAPAGSEPIISMKDDSVTFDEDTLARLRAGELTKKEVDALIEQGLTLEDLQDPYAIAPMAITTHYEHVDSGYFKFIVNKPEQTLAFETYAGEDGLTSVYNYLPATWAGPVNKAQVNENDEYYQSRNAAPVIGGVKPDFTNNYDPEVTGEFNAGKLGTDLENLYYPHLYGKVNGVEYEVARVSYHDTTVKRIGNVLIEVSDSEEPMHYIYVSSGRTTGSTSHFIIPTNPDGSVESDNKITVEYQPLEYGITYEVYVDNLDGKGGQLQSADNATFGRHAIFGSTRSEKTVEQIATATVTIPDGYYARVYIGDKTDEGDFPTSYISYADSQTDYVGRPGVTSIHEKFPTERGYGEFPLGMGPSFKTAGDTGSGPDAVVLDGDAPNTPSYFTLSAVYSSGDPGSGDTEMVIRVVIGKRTNFTVSNELWGETQTDGVVQQDKIKGNLLGGERTIFIKKDEISGDFIFDDARYKEIKPSTGQPYIKPEDVRVNGRTGEYSFTWIFTTKTRNGENFQLQTLSVNGESVDVPSVSTNDPSHATVNDLGKVDSKPRVKLQNAEVEVSVRIVDTKSAMYEGDETDYGDQYQRRYEVRFTNVTRNIVITTSALCPSDHQSFSVSNLDGVDLERWDGSRNTWTEVTQGEVLHVSQGLLWENYPTNLPTDQNGEQITGNFNVRAKPHYGYELPGEARLHTGKPDENGEPDGVAGTVDGITYTNGSGQVQKINALAGPDANGWFYLDLSGGEGDSYYLSIYASLKRYQVKYLNGSRSGPELQPYVDGLPDVNTLQNFPDFSDWNGLTAENYGDDYRVVDNNNQKYYNLNTASSIRVSANIPQDPAERPAVFKFWVLTNEQGKPIDRYGQPHLGYKTTGSDGSDLSAVKGDTLRQLADVIGGAVRDEKTGIYTFYLTAYWTPAAEAFSYYIVFDKIDETGADKMDAYYPGSRYPILNKATGERTGRYATVDRNAYTKVTSTTVVFDPDSDLVAEYMATDPWYELYEGQEDGDRHRNGNNGLFVYTGVGNRDIMNVWFAYTLGGLTVANTVDKAKLDHTFSYTVSFKLPEDNSNTTGDETLFFDQGFQSYVNSITSSRRADGGTSVSYEKDAADRSLTGVYSIGYKDQSGQLHTLPLNKQGDGTYTGTFTLEGGQSAVFDDLPVGTEYTVTEQLDTAGYSLSKATKTTEIRTDADTDPETTETINTAAVSGTIAALTDDAVTYANELGLELEVSQSVHGNAATTDDIYVKPDDVITYTVRAVNASSKALTATVSDKLPDNLEYVAGSASSGGSYAGGTVTWNSITLQPSGSAGNSMTYTFQAKAKIGDPTQNATVVNEAAATSGTSRYLSNKVTANYVPANLTVSKTVSGKGREEERNFTFMVTLSDTTVNGTYGDMTFTAGGAQIQMKHGESKTARNLPSGVTYRVQEVEAGLSGYTTTVTDENAATVTGSYAEGTLSEKDVTVAFKNSRPESTSTTLNGKTTLSSSDKSLEDEEFEFIILPNLGTGASGTGPIPTSGRIVKNDGEGNIVFLTEADKYVAPGVYTYSVRVHLPETIPAGYTFDTTTYTVVVTVTLDEASDTLSVAGVTISKAGASGTVESILFENVYRAGDVTAVARARKEFNGDLASGEFTLELDAVEPSNAPLPGGVSGSATTVNGAGGQFQFDPFTFENTGKYVYKFSEHDDGDPNIDYDDTVYYCVVVVSTDGYRATYYKGEEDYRAERNPLTINDVIFKNVLKNGLTVKKTVTGEGAGAEDAFSFTVTLDDESINGTGDYGTYGASHTPVEFVNGVANFSLKNGESAEITGIPVKTGYTVVENSANQNGYITTVKDGNAEGAITEGDPVTVEFVNRKPAAAQVDTAKLTGKVTLTTDSLVDLSLQNDQFSFVILPYGNNPKNGPVRERTTIGNTAAGDIPFYDLFSSDGFTTAGTYRYTVRQPSGNARGYQYDTAEYVVTVVVTDNGGNRLERETSITVTKDGFTGPTDAITFANVYAPAGATIDEVNGNAANSLLVRKALTGAPLTNGLFYFMITADDSNPQNGGPIGVDPETGGKRKTVQNDGAGYISLFGNSTFSKAGEYNYVITEMNRGTPGYTYDSTEYRVKVNVTDNNAAGRLEATVVSVNGRGNTHTITFQNSYYAPTTVNEGGDNDSAGTADSLVARKVLTGATLTENQFRFVIEPMAGNSGGDPVTETRYVYHAGNGRIKLFDGLTYTKAGSYKYTVSELIPATIPSGYTYDETRYTVTVTVTESLANGAGKLVAKTAVTGPSGDTGNTIVFNNKYESNAVTVTEGAGGLQASKTLTGGTLTDGQFRFTVTPEAGNPAGDPITSAKTVTNAADGAIKLFENVYYDTVGDYKYTVSEVNDHASGYTYDDSVYTVTVSVTEAGGQLTAATSVTLDGADTGNSIVFENSYSAGPAGAATVDEGNENSAASLVVKKTLTGGSLKANQFSFTITPVVLGLAGDPIPKERTVKNSANGSVKLFDGVQFTTAGDYKYTVKEVNAREKGYTYDDSEYTVSVSVKDNGAGQLTATTAVLKGTADMGNRITFQNTYVYTGGSDPGPGPGPDPGPGPAPAPEECDGGANCPSRAFTDLNPSAWYHKATDYVITKKLMSGTSTTTFSPNSTLTRAMLVTILWRAAGSPKSTTGSNPFKDVPANQYYYQAVMWAYENNVVAGTTSTTFSPNSPITREQLAAILWRYAGSPGTSGSFAGFTDSNKVSAYAEIAMRWTLEHGIMSGKGNGILDPGGKSTRAEAASMLMRYLERDTDTKNKAQ